MFGLRKVNRNTHTFETTFQNWKENGEDVALLMPEFSASSLSLVYTIYILGHIAVSFFGYPLQNPHYKSPGIATLLHNVKNGYIKSRFLF